MSQPTTNAPISFAQSVKPLFRDKDVRSMRFRFDLESYDDVSAHAEHILARLQAGTMPCDEAWPADKVDVFARWVSGGKKP